MTQFDASDPACACVQCAVCENPIKSGKWFARIKHDDRMVALCCPLCEEVFQAKPQPYVRRIEMLERAQPPEGIAMPD